MAVAEERSFSRAADRLQVVQSAVSATIRALEREWGVTLFHRTTHRVELSVEGRTLLPDVRTALAAADAVGHAVDEVHGGLRGTLRLGIMQASAVPEGRSAGTLLSAFRAEHPAVEVEVRQDGSVTQAAAVRSGALDLAMVGMPDRDLVGLRSVPLVDGGMALACAPGHPLAARPAVTLADLRDEAFADLPPTWSIRVIVDRAFAAAGTTRRVRHEINDMGTVVDFVRHGLAVAIVPRTVADDAGVVFVPIVPEAPRFLVRLVAPVDRPVSAVARAFIATAERIGRDADAV